MDDIFTPFARHILSQDIGKKQDATTSGVFTITPEYFDGGDGRRRVTTFLDVGFLDKRRLSYMELGEYTQEMLQSLALGDQTALIIDGTGIGETVYDIYTSLGLEPVKIIFTSGETAAVEKNRTQFSKQFGAVSGYKVPKADMISASQVIFQQGRIRFAEGIDFRDECFQQLQSFVGKVNEKTHNVKYENLSEDIHDDFVTMIIQACWYVMHMDSRLMIPSDQRGMGAVRSYGGSSYSVDPFEDL